MLLPEHSLYCSFNVTASVVYWLELLATDPEARVRFPALPGKKKAVGLESGPLSLVNTTEQLERKVAASI
jgi:hypothetical protein